jgi:hypothetical protein
LKRSAVDRSPERARRLRFAMPFGTAIEPDCVHLIGGEDVRFSLRAPELEQWLPPLLQRLAGGESDAELFRSLPEERRAAARELVDQLLGERVLVVEPGPRPAGRAWALQVEGEGRLAERVRALVPEASEASAAHEPLAILCQDRLDYRAARERSAELRALRRAHL